MQIMADVTNMNVSVVESEQAVALGVACFASVVGGCFGREVLH
ncbi:MAG: FGGY-family carbohydrate kinase [Vallitaleaceae bacterium]|jgi:ribulose kinase|nr:FGGY-family carbohydrate kinase [Vallitaleaceae bacterium]